MHSEAQPLAFPLLGVAPFVLMLLSIALVPFWFPNWWDRNINKFLISIAASILALIVILPNAPHLLMHALLDYVSFIALLGALFVETT